MGELNYKLISKKLNISTSALARLTGSTKVELKDTSYELGLRLEKNYLEQDLQPAGFTDEVIIEACRLYEKTCPAVYQWICSGDFCNGDFKKATRDLKVKPAVIIHACRSAGRIRAEMMRG